MDIKQKNVKRGFDLILASFLVICLLWLILLLIVLATFDTKSFGVFCQKRIGYRGKSFFIFKIRTMTVDTAISTNVTTYQDPRITNIGRILRKYKLDELPQLFNVLIGNMSFVGPRPDVPGYADKLLGDDRIILTVKPGVTSEASLCFREEEELLSQKDNPLEYNNKIIWPQKVAMNKEYVKKYSFSKDINILFKTLFYDRK